MKHTQNRQIQNSAPSILLIPITTSIRNSDCTIQHTLPKLVIWKQQSNGLAATFEVKDMNKRFMDFEEFDAVLLYDEKTGDLRNKVDRGRHGKYKAGEIATTKHSAGYLQVSLDGEIWPAHRVAWLLYTGECLSSTRVVHLNKIKTDNRIENLKINACTSSMTGVSRHSGGKGWVVLVSPKNAKRMQKYCTDFFEACCLKKSTENKSQNPNC